LDVWARIRQLPDQIDVVRSRCTEFPDRRLALRLEKIFHICFKVHNRPRPHGGDGHTEWYDYAALEEVINFIERNQATLRCGAIQILPVKESKHVKALADDLSPWQKAEKRKLRIAQEIAKHAKDNHEKAMRFMNWLKRMQEQSALIGWFGNILVLWLEDFHDEDKNEVRGGPIFTSRRGTCSLIGMVEYVSDICLIEFVADPPELVEYLSRFSIHEAQSIQDALVGISAVPESCIQDLELLTRMDFFEHLCANERECDERSKLQEKIISRILANVVEDRRPTPYFEQLAIAIA
jgi:hypothetical protein